MSETMQKKHRGTVKWFNDQKGFGFITRDGDRIDFFVHFRQIVGDGYRTLQNGQKVTFTGVDGPKGFAAEEVEGV